MDFVELIGKLVRVIAEQPLDRVRLDLVVGRRRCAVRVDVIDLFRADSGIGDRIQHDAVRAVAVFRRQRDVEGVAAHAVSDKFGDDLGAALLREFEFFEHEDAGAFADDKTVAILVEGPGSALRFFVARGKSAHGGKSTDAHRRDRGFRAAADHDVRVAA